MKRECLALIILLLVAMGTAACSRNPSHEPHEMVDIGSHSLHIHCMGRERSDCSPTVVIDVGFGDSYTNTKWHTMQKRIAKDVCVCAYDRAGYGLSEPGPFPRSSQQVVNELRTLLHNDGVEAPYVLVGHSLGGLNTQAFISQYPGLVAGAVLLDPPQVMAIESYGHMSLIVLASGKPNPAFGQFAKAFQQFWIEQNQALATRSTRGTCIPAAESGHHLYADVPGMVLDAIRHVVEQARGA